MLTPEAGSCSRENQHEGHRYTDNNSTSTTNTNTSNTNTTPVSMPGHRPNLFAVAGVPDLHQARVGADREVRASLRPRHGRNDVCA